jgi:hypothetical protein
VSPSGDRDDIRASDRQRFQHRAIRAQIFETKDLALLCIGTGSNTRRPASTVEVETFPPSNLSHFVTGLGFRVSGVIGLGFRVSGVIGLGFRVSGVIGLGFRVSGVIGLGFRVSGLIGLGFRVSGVIGLGFRVSGVIGLGFRVSGFRCKVRGVGGSLKSETSPLVYHMVDT